MKLIVGCSHLNFTKSNKSCVRKQNNDHFHELKQLFCMTSPAVLLYGPC